MRAGIKDRLFAFRFRALADTLQCVSVVSQAPDLCGVDDATIFVLDDGEDKSLITPGDLRMEAVTVGSGRNGLFAVRGVVLEGMLLREKGTKCRGLDRQLGIVVLDAQGSVAGARRDAVRIVLLP